MNTPSTRNMVNTNDRITASQFQSVVNRRLALTTKVLAAKQAEYAQDDREGNRDTHANFNAIAAHKQAHGIPCTRSLAVYDAGLLKHWTSIFDMVKQGMEGEADFTKEAITEKFGDAINYLILLEASVLAENGYDLNRLND